MILRSLLTSLFALALAAADSAQVGVVWATKSTMADRVFAGLSRTIAAKAPGIQLDVRQAVKDDAAAAAIYDEWQGTKQGVVVLRSPGSKMILANPPKVPVFVGACNNPVELGLVKDLNAPDGLVTGVTYFLPYERHLEAYRSIWPELKQVGLLLMKGHASAPIEEKGTVEAGKAMGITVAVHWCDKKNDVALGAKALVDGGAQLLIIANQNLIFDNAAAIVAAAGTVPVMSYAEKPISAKQVVGGLTVDDYALGDRLGEQIIEVVLQGKAVKDVPVGLDPQPRLRLVKDRIAALGIQVPEAVLAKATVE